FCVARLIVPVAKLLVNDEVPATVNTPDWVRLPAVVSVTTRLPPMPHSLPTRRSSDLRLASAPAPVVLSDTAPLSALLCVARLIVPGGKLLVNDEVPATVNTPDCVRLPAVVSVTTRLPPMPEVPRSVATVFFRLASAPA